MFLMMPSSYWLFLLPALALAGLATLFTQVTFGKYSRRRAASGMTGAEASRRMLDAQGVRGVNIEQVRGFLSDHYDPSSRTLRLSPGVYGSNSLSAIGVACHEAGHAVQHAQHYAPLMLRTSLVPVTMVGSHLAYILFFLGMFMRNPALEKFAVLLFGLGLVFALVTLPVEWDATARAKRVMVTAGIVSPPEEALAARVLNAAFLTYVAAVFMALMELLYWLWRTGLIGGGGRRR
jgi:Zn-dependent membrane protease YugP